MTIDAGTKLGRYEIRSQLGAGGMGEVYLAEDTKLERIIALKILPSELVENADRVRRFKDEAKRASALNHRYILTIYEIGEAQPITPGRTERGEQPEEAGGQGGEASIHYIAMEYIDGETLREKIYRERTPLRKLVKYLAQVAEGLAKAHAAGIVHRDLKPDNIMITRDGYAKILDFGLAKLVEQKQPVAGDATSSEVATAVLAQHSIPGTVLGTVGYMSPEQAQGKTREIDHRSDIFSFGCILFEAASGRKAFEGVDPLDSLHKIVHAPTPQIKDFNASAPEELQRIVRRCLMKDADRRYQSIKDVAIELEEIRQELESESDIDRTVQPEARSGEAMASDRSPALSTAGEAAARSTDSGVVGATDERLPSSSTGSHPEIASGQSQAEAVSVATVPGRAKRSLRVVVPLAVTLLVIAVAVGAFFFGRSTAKILSPSYHKLTFRRGTIWNARFASDGQTIVYSATWNGNPLEVFATHAGNVESRPLQLGNTDVLAISASNEMAVLRNRQYLDQFISRGTLARMPVDGGAAREILEDVQEADWSPDGTKLALVRWVNGRNRLEYPVGKVLYETAGYISHPRISPKGDLVAFMDHQVQWDNRGWVVIVDLTGKKTVLSGEWAGEEGLAWSPAGDEVWFTATKGGEADALYAVTLSGRERLVVRMTSNLMLHDISRDGRVLLTNYKLSTNILAQPPGENKERDLSWLDSGLISDLSPDGKTILFDYQGEGSGINYAVYLRKTDGSPAVRLGDGNSQRLSPDGKWALAVLYTPPQLVLLPTGSGEARQLERGPIEQYGGLASWFADGKRVVFQGREPGHDWRYYMQSIEGGQPRPITPEGTTGPSLGGILISPDGRLVIASDAQHQRSFYPVEGGAPQAIAHLESEDEIIGWSSDRRSLFVARTAEIPRRVYRFDPSTGRKELLKEIAPADPAGILFPSSILMTPDGKGYAYWIGRVLSDLYLVEGLK